MDKETALAVWDCVDGLDSSIEVAWYPPLGAGGDADPEPHYFVRARFRPETRTDELAAIMASCEQAAGAHKLVITLGDGAEGKVTFA